MRSISANTSVLQFLAADAEARPVLDFDSDTKAQKRDENGRLLWSLGVFIVAPDGADKHAVKFAADSAPVGFSVMGPIIVEDLTVIPYINNGRVALSMRAAKVARAAAAKPATA